MKDEFMTEQQAAEKRGISDRRVRVLCHEGKISGAVKDGKSHKIPVNAVKPADGRRRKTSTTAIRFLRWENDIIGTIDNANTVEFIKPEYNKVVSLYTCGAKKWSSEQFLFYSIERDFIFCYNLLHHTILLLVFIGKLILQDQSYV